MKICILGGCGYVGTTLIHLLLENKNIIKVIDTQWFGNRVKKHRNLKIVKKDIRDVIYKDFLGFDIIIHLANVANDPTVELQPDLSWNVNVLSMINILDSASKAKIKKIIYSSSGSVYGVKKEKKVTEELSLNPISIYNKTKIVAEKILFSYARKFKIICIRPATVCGYSERMRLDLTVNLLTYQALKNKLITVFGGQQIRPSIHIKDLCEIFRLATLKNFKPGIYNAGFENTRIIDIAKKINKIIPCKIKILSSNDPRSYRQDSTKILKMGFRPVYNIDFAINEIKEKFINQHFSDNIDFYNLKKMKQLNTK
jgi:nucleoside-diphosphate-sugar epimerase